MKREREMKFEVGYYNTVHYSIAASGIHGRGLATIHGVTVRIQPKQHSDWPRGCSRALDEDVGIVITNITLLFGIV